MTFLYKDSRGAIRTGEMEILRSGGNLELDIKANGWMFHAIIGSHRDGNFLCIPNWDVGSELAGLDDGFWNEERLRNHTTLHSDNIKAVVGAVEEADRWIKKQKQGGCG